MKVFKNENQALELATENLNLLLKNFENKEILLMISGGSALKLLEGVRGEFLNKKVTITTLDERFTTDSQINNFFQMTNTRFFTEAKAVGCTFWETVPLENDPIDDFATRVELNLKNWRKNYPEGVIITTQGIGQDGHTAGIMPFPENPQLFTRMFEGESWVIGYDAGKKNPYSKRVTTTLTFLRQQVDYSIVYAVGKETIIKRLQKKEESAASLPSMVFYEMKNVSLFTD